MKVAIIGMGNMGSKYAAIIGSGKIPGMSLVAVTRVKPEVYNRIKDSLPEDLEVVDSDIELFRKYDERELVFDSVIVVTPHYSHESICEAAFNRGLNVLCDKPAGVYSRQARKMMKACNDARKKNPDLKYGFVFHQRTYPAYVKLKELVNNPDYGNLKRINWTVTDWYRSNAYYSASNWRGTWSKDGGGTILNQCPHNLDMICWLFGCPRNVVAVCHEGKYHPIEVEDEVTAYMQWKGGASGVFVASTGEACGVNRFEIAMDNALIVCEGNKIVVKELDRPEIEYRLEDGDGFTRPITTTKEFECDAPEGAYEKILCNFANDKDLIADGSEAIQSLYLSNAIYLSSWLNSRVDIPGNKAEEKVFEDAFEKVLNRKVRGR